MTHVAAGQVDPRFAAVGDAFDALLVDDPDYSSQLAVYWRGELVVDLVGGPELARDSLIGLHSAGKGVAALCLAQLVDGGLLDLDQQMGHYWPEFAAHGKDRITVRQVLSHQAGLLGTAEGLTTADFCSRGAAEKLAGELPVWLPGSAFGYHRRTIGALMEELFLRVAGRTLQEHFRSRIGVPRGIDVFFGLADQDEGRFVPTRYAPGSGGPASDDGPGTGPGSLAALARGQEERIPPNIPELRRHGPVANGAVGSAEGLARVYAAVVDEVAGPPLLSPQTAAEFAQQQVFGTCMVTQRVTGYGVVFERPRPQEAYASYRSLGHRGANGTLGFADPLYRIGFGFVRQPGIVGGVAPEARRLAATVQDCVHRAGAA